MTVEEAIAAVRAKLSRRFISGRGLEIGAGARPFPVPPGAQVSYGDMRDRAALQSYFKTDAVQSGREIDAQTLAAIADASLDFVISAHVIEHLRDPIGAIVNAIRVLKRGGIHLFVLRKTSLASFRIRQFRRRLTVRFSTHGITDGSHCS